MKNPKLFYSVIIGLIVIFGGMVFYSAQKKKAENQKIIDYFNSNREQIVSSIDQLILSEKYQDAVDTIDQYSSIIDDGVFAQLKEKMEWQKEKNSREKRTKEILKEWKNEIRYFWDKPHFVSYYEKLHKELVELNPDNEKFIEMQNAFLKKKKNHEEIKKRELERAKKDRELYEKEQKERIVKFGEPPDTTIWGLHGYEGPVMKYLKQRAHNPPSVSIIGCSELSFTPDGWILFCEYRGQNAFGGMIHDTKAFTIVNGKVTKMENPNVYGQ